MDSFTVTSTWAISFLVGLLAFAITAWVRVLAERLYLIEHPNDRSSHYYPTPNGGGLGIVLASLPAGIWLFWASAEKYAPMLIMAGVIASVGLWDDLRHVSRRIRFSVQILASTLLITQFATLPDTLALLPQQAIWFLGLLMILAGTWWINLFNFMDGIDGIAASQAVFMLGGAAIAGAWFHPEFAATSTWLWMWLIAAATLGFLWHNWAPARIFMGDIGSTYLAFMILALACITVREGWLTYSFWLVLAAVFISDASVTLIRRIATGQSWLQPHRCHAYQRLTRRWNSHARVTSLSVSINLFWLAPIAMATLAWPEQSLLLVMLAYLPLLIGIVMLDAGKPESIST